MKSVNVKLYVGNNQLLTTENTVPSEVADLTDGQELKEKVNSIEALTTSEVFNLVEDVLDPALPAPTNVQAEGTSITFDEVEGAESYIVYADGDEIGEVPVQVGGEE